MGQMGEWEFSFPTHAGNIYVESTSDAMSPYGGLVAFASFLKRCNILEDLATSCPVERTSPNAAPIYDILCSFMLTALCDGDRFNHVNRLRYDTVFPSLFGVKKIVGDDTIRRFLKSLEKEKSRQWFSDATKKIWSCLPKNFILDWDSTVLTKYGNQEDAEIGYNPQKRGRRSFHPLMATVAGTRLCPYYRWRAGNAASSSQCIEAMQECLDWLGEYNRPILNRGDISFGNEKIMKWHEDNIKAPKYLFKLKVTNTVKNIIDTIPEGDWLGASSIGLLQVVDREIKLSTWSKARRVVLGRRLYKSETAEQASKLFDYIEFKYEAYVTDLSIDEIDTWQLVDFYNQRADCENIFDELKNQWGIDGFCSKHAQVTESAARLTLLTYNLWNLFSRLMEPKKHVEGNNGRRWYMLMASRLVTNAREKVVKIAINNKWKTRIKDGYERVYDWVKQTAPQLAWCFKIELNPLLKINKKLLC